MDVTFLEYQAYLPDPGPLTETAPDQLVEGDQNAEVGRYLDLGSGTVP